MSGYELIIFDCDGTLVDSELCSNQCAVDIFREYGLDFTLEHAYEHWLGRDFIAIMERIEEENNIDLPEDEIYAKFVGRMPLYHEKHLKPVEGALESVRALHGKFKTCVASNGEKPNIVNSLRLCGFGDIFKDDAIHTKNEVKRPKPYPDLFLYAEEKSGGMAGRSIVIEDSLTGVKAGRAANMYTIGFTGAGHSPLNSAENLKAAGADIVFHRWEDILVHINSGL